MNAVAKVQKHQLLRRQVTGGDVVASHQIYRPGRNVSRQDVTEGIERNRAEGVDVAGRNIARGAGHVDGEGVDGAGRDGAAIGEDEIADVEIARRDRGAGV